VATISALLVAKVVLLALKADLVHVMRLMAKVALLVQKVLVLQVANLLRVNASAANQRLVDKALAETTVRNAVQHVKHRKLTAYTIKKAPYIYGAFFVLIVIHFKNFPINETTIYQKMDYLSTEPELSTSNFSVYNLSFI